MKTITTLEALLCAAKKRQSVTNWKPNTEDNPKPAAWVLMWPGDRLVVALRAGLKVYTPKIGKWKRKEKANTDTAEYRELVDGDIFMEGDEFWNSRLLWWQPTSSYYWKNRLTFKRAGYTKHRRPIKKDSK